MAESTSNFFTKLFESLFGSNDPEVEKKRRLKSIAKDLSKSKYHFYKASSDEVQPTFAKLFYEIYKCVSPAQTMFQNVQNPNTFKFLLVDYSLSDKQKALYEALTEDSIRAQAETTPIDKLTREVNDALNAFLNGFDPDKIESIEKINKQLSIFKAFCSYDFYFMLKKFDSTLHEKEFNVMPKFDKITGTYILEDLKDFISIAWNIPEKENWTPLVNFLKASKGVEPIALSTWNKICQKIISIKDSQTFEMMVKLISKNPEYKVEDVPIEGNIIDSYLEKIKNDTNTILQKLTRQQKDSKAGELLMQIFGTTSVVRLRNYTAATSAILEKKDLGSYEYCNPLNYYKAFLIDFVKKNLREFADLVLVRGAWVTTSLSAPMSNAYHALLDASLELSSFDESLAEEAEIGVKIKTLLPRVDRDRESRNIVITLLKDINTKAHEMCIEGTKNLIVIAKTIKSLLEDYSKTKNELIINWKEIEHFSEHPVKDIGIEVYKEIYLFVTLMQNCLSNE